MFFNVLMSRFYQLLKRMQLYYLLNLFQNQIKTLWNWIEETNQSNTVYFIELIFCGHFGKCKQTTINKIFTYSSALFYINTQGDYLVDPSVIFSEYHGCIINVISLCKCLTFDIFSWWTTFKQIDLNVFRVKRFKFITMLIER